MYGIPFLITLMEQQKPFNVECWSLFHTHSYSLFRVPVWCCVGHTDAIGWNLLFTVHNSTLILMCQYLSTYLLGCFSLKTEKPNRGLLIAFWFTGHSKVYWQTFNQEIMPTFYNELVWMQAPNQSEFSMTSTTSVLFCS